MKTRREKTPASVPAAVREGALDVSMLPTYGFSHRSLMWWGTAGMIAIEGTAFAFMVIVYFYLRSRAQSWPDGGAAPDLLWGTLNLVIILLSVIPNTWADKAALDHDLPRVRIAMIGSSVAGILLCGVRWMEFTALNVRWDASAYGSCVWMALGLHTFNLVTDVVDTLVLTAVTFKEPVEGRRYVDIAENSGYWDFIVLSWIPIYAVIYWAPRF